MGPLLPRPVSGHRLSSGSLSFGHVQAQLGLSVVAEHDSTFAHGQLPSPRLAVILGTGRERKARVVHLSDGTGATVPRQGSQPLVQDSLSP